MSAFRVVPVDAARLPDWRRLFVAGRDAGEWWWHCHCFTWHWTGGMEAWDARTPEQNRDAMAERLAAGDSHGVLAYEGDEPVGWCRVGPRATFAFTLGREPAPPEPPRLGVVACFVVRREWRGRGVATALLAGAEALLRALGCDVVEAYPNAEPDPEDQGMSGVLPLFTRAGYAEVRALGTRRVVRKALR